MSLSDVINGIQNRNSINSPGERVAVAARALLDEKDNVLLDAGEIRRKRLVAGFNTALRAFWVFLQKPIVTRTYASTIDLDFATVEAVETVALTGVLTFTFSNLAAGREKVIRLVGDGSSRNLTWPASITWMGSAPTALASGKTAQLHLRSYGTTAADVVATYSVQS